MTKHWLYLKYVLRHKYLVFVSGWKIGVPLHRLILHDWTKFLPSEWFPYVNNFYGAKVARPNVSIFENDKMVPLMEPPLEVADAFDVAWNHHQKRNDHHWQYWLLTPDKPRPNFNQQSYDGDMSHSYFRSVHGKDDVAIIWDAEIEWWHYNYDAAKAMDADLRHVTVALPMPENARAEMLADWHGAGRALGKPDTLAWYMANRDKIKLHPETRQFVEVMLEVEEPRLAKPVRLPWEKPA